MKKTQDTPLKDLTDAELLAELARRRASKVATADMTSIELDAEALKHEVGELHLAHAIIDRASREDDKPTRCPKCGGHARIEEKKRERTVQTLSGKHTYRRNYQRCLDCRHGFAPVDDELGIPAEGAVTLEVEKRILDFGVNDVFDEGARRFSMHYGWSISDNLVRRVVDRVADCLESISEPALQAALLPSSSTPARLVTIGIDGSMLSTTDGWQETKVGVVVRDEHHVVGTRVRRGEVTEARYVTASTVEEMKTRLWHAAAASGVESAEQVVVVSDGAPWIKNIADELFPGALQVLDWPHVVAHLTECGKALLGEHSPWLAHWVRTTTTLAWNGRTKELIQDLRALLDLDDVDHQPVINLLRYLKNNEDRVDYRRFRTLGLPTGSGIAESAHKHVLQVRMKRAGQHWSPRRARRMARLRAASRMAGPHLASRIRSAGRARLL